MAKSTVSKSSPAILPAKKLSAEKVGLPLHGCVQHANPAAIPCVAETDESLFRNIKFRVQLASAQNASRDQICRQRSTFLCSAVIGRQISGHGQSFQAARPTMQILPAPKESVDGLIDSDPQPFGLAMPNA